MNVDFLQVIHTAFERRFTRQRSVVRTRPKRFRAFTQIIEKLSMTLTANDKRQDEISFSPKHGET